MLSCVLSFCFMCSFLGGGLEFHVFMYFLFPCSWMDMGASPSAHVKVLLSALARWIALDGMDLGPLQGASVATGSAVVSVSGSAARAPHSKVMLAHRSGLGLGFRVNVANYG